MSATITSGPPGNKPKLLQQVRDVVRRKQRCLDPFDFAQGELVFARGDRRPNASNISKARGVSVISKPDLLNVDSNRDRGVGHCAAVMRVWLSFWQEIPGAGRHLASFR
jgi:hypothetical protein